MIEEKKESRTVCFGYGKLKDQLACGDCYVSTDREKSEIRVDVSADRCRVGKIAYLHLRKQLRKESSVETVFLMKEPIKLLLETMSEWYEKGEKKRAFPFFSFFRQEIERLSPEDAVGVRSLARWLEEKNLRPLFNPQIATIDPLRRESLVERLLEKEFARVVITDDLHQKPSGTIGPFDYGLFFEHFEYFESILGLDFHLYQKYLSPPEPSSSHELKSSGKDFSESGSDSRSKKKLSKEFVGKVTQLSHKRIKGWIDGRLLERGKSYKIILKVDGETLRRKKLSEKEVGQERIPFHFIRLELKARQKVELFLLPGRRPLKFSKKQKLLYRKNANHKS